MSTIDHVVAECGRLRTAWTWLTEATIPGRARRNQRVTTERAKAARDKQAAAERNDRAKLLIAGKLLAGNQHAPANINALDAREKIAADIDHTAWVMTSNMRQRGYNNLRQSAYRPDGRTTDHRFRNAVDWISLNAPRLQDDQPIVNSTYRSLVDATTLATAVSGAGADRRHLAALCPACGMRSLAWDCTSPDYREWHVLCTAPTCRCQGRDCGCHKPDRTPGMTHVWLESSWARLAEQLEETA